MPGIECYLSDAPVMDLPLETERLQILQSMAVFDTPPDPRFDRITHLAARVFRVPTAVICLADQNRHWFISRFGVNITEISRRNSFCDHTIAHRACFVVLDARQDTRFAVAPMVSGPPFVRFYAGARLIGESGISLGSLCLLDSEPHADFSATDCNILSDLASTVVELLEARSRQRELVQRTREMRLTAGILKLISDAPSWERAIEGVLGEICGQYGAAMCSLWRLEPDLHHVALLHAHAAEAADRNWYQALQTVDFTVHNSVIGRCLRARAPLCLDLLSLDVDRLTTQQQHNLQQMTGRGLTALVFQPIALGDDAFVFVLMFRADRHDLPAVSDSLQDLADTLKPALYRRVCEDHLRLLFQHNPVPMWVYDVETLAFLEVNEAATRRYGWSREAFLGKTVMEVTPAQSRAGFHACQRGITDNFTQFGPVTHIRADGQSIQTMVARHDIPFAGRKARLSALWDVSEVEQARRELSVNHERLQRLTEALRGRTEELTEAHRIAKLGTWRWEFDQPLVTWSAEMFRIAGRDPDSFVLSPDSIIGCVHPDDRARIDDMIARVSSERTAMEYEVRLIRPDGGVRYCWANARPALDDNGAVIGLHGVMQDISQRKDAEKALFRADRLLTIGQLTGGVAHDFNNLLMVVSLSLEEVIERLPPADTLRRVLDPALHATMRGKQLTSQLLSYASRQALKPETLQLVTHLAGFQPLLQRAIGERYQLRFAAEPHLSPCTVDPAQLEHAVMNLVINARDAMPDGGAIAIAAANVRIAPRPDQPGHSQPGNDDVVPPGDYVRLTVSDAGCGIPPQMIGRVFEPFFTTKPSGQGSGLGLSMVYGFARQSGGQVLLSSEAGSGTRVELYLLAATSPAAPSVAAECAQHWHAGHRRVLLVEDQIAVQRVVQRMMTGIGFDVTCASNGAEALALLAQSGPFALLFSDVVLPGTPDGVGLAAHAAAHHPQMRVMLTSGYTDHSVDGALADGPALAFLMKPYRRHELIERLQQMFGEAAD